MKKIVSALLCLAFLAAMSVSYVSAAGGQILFEDHFNTVDDNWEWGGDLFEVENGILKGEPAARVHQTKYIRDDGVPLRIWSELACKIDVRITDYDDSTLVGPGLWFRDYNTTYDQQDEGEEDTGEVWWYEYDYISNSVILRGDHFENNKLEPVKVKLEDGIVKAGPDEKPTTFSIGWRIQPGHIECYFNDKKVIDYTNVPMTIGSVRPSPIVLWNNSCYIEFDNFIVSTPDYNLFNEVPGDNGGNNGGNQQPGNATEIVTEYETNDKGETIVVTKVVADTNANNPSANNGGSNTGDMIVAVAAVMAVAAAGAIVVAKRRDH